MGRTLAEISEKMRDIDFAMLSTRAPNGAVASRPMSNNREVAYDGDSYYFAFDDASMVTDIERDRQVGLSFQGKAGLLGMRPFFIAVEGDARIIQDRQVFAVHWTKDLDRWFTHGIDTPDLAMIHVRATRIHYWDGEEDGEVAMRLSSNAPA